MHYHHDIGPCAGTGKTQKAARQEAEAMAAMMLTGSFEPQCINYRNWTGITYRTQQGWQYVIYHDETVMPNRSSRQAYSHDERDNCIMGMMRHLCQNAWQHSDGPNTPTFVEALYPTVAADLRNYFAWQIRYKDYRNQGKTDLEAHHLASRC